MRLALAASLALAFGIASAAQAQVKLELKDREGTTITRTTGKTHQILSIAGMDIETTGGTSITNRSVTGKAGADGTVRIRETIEAIKSDLSLPGDMKVSFDSSKPDAKSDNPDLQGLIDLWRSMKGAGYTLVVGPDHKIKGIEGNDLEKTVAKAQGQYAELAKGRLGKDVVIREAEQARDVLPDKPVNKGDRWQRTHVMDAGGGQHIAFDTYYEYAGTVEKNGKTLDKIDAFVGGVTYSLDPNSPLPLKLLKSDLKIDSSVGSVLFDREKGQIVESTSTTRITGPITFSVNGQELPAKLDLTIEQGSRTE